MDLEFWATTDVGRVRDHNEDNFLVDKRLRLFVVCDGMGGHAAGEVASAMAVKIVREIVAENRDVFERLDQDPESVANRKAVMGVCETSISQACQRIFLAAQEDPSKRGMGTTCSMLLLRGSRGFIGHVGDSRIYLLRNGQVHQITEDHSLINEMLRLGKIQKGEEHKIPHKNAVTRAVGVNEFVEVDTFQLDTYGGDQFLLCSDGLCGYFTTDEDISQLMDTEDVREATEKCITFANEGGGKDNITSIVVRVTGDDGTGDIKKTLEALRATPYFQYLTYKEMVQVVNLTDVQEYATGEVICEEDGANDTMYLVVQGSIQVLRSGVDIGIFNVADHIGDSALIDEDARPFKAVALADATVLALTRDRFMELLRQDSELAVKLLWNFVQTFAIRMRESEAKFESQRAVLDPPQTPPSGNLIFEEDKSRSEAPPALEFLEGSESSEDDTIDIDRAAVGGHLDWENGPEEITFDDPVEEPDEDLRATVGMSVEDEATRTLPTLAAMESGVGSAISGTSMTHDEEAPPKSQVMRRSKLIVGASAPMHGSIDVDATQEATSLAERLKRRAEESKADDS